MKQVHCVYVLSLLCVCSTLHAEFPKPFNTEPISQDTLMPAAEAAAKMQLPDGFKATVFADEPDVQNPIAACWDSCGRLWVAENYTYAEREQRFQLDLRDRVVIFDNARGDRFKTRKVFTDNATMLTGLAVGRGGVWLMCPPQLIFVPDANGDDVPDSAGEVVLDGFTVAKQNYHNFANGLRFGPDGWLYGRCGGSCPGRIGLPGSPDHHRLALEGGIWRYHPTRRRYEVLTTGTTNPWGHDWNGVGEMFFTNTVNGHLWHATPGAHFTRPFLMDPNRRIYELIDFHADHWHFDTGKSWTQSRDGAANSFGGGHAHSGAMIYQGDNWPAQYRGNLFTLNFHGRRSNQEKLVRSGSGYVAKHGEDMLLAEDPWFRGMDLMTGPDGGVFVLDWSDAGECHEHTGVHRTSGRIFKVVHDQGDTESKPHEPFDIREWTGETLAMAHRSPNDWYVRQARLELGRRAAVGANLEKAAELLRAMFESSSGDSRLAVQTLLSRQVIGAVGPDELRKLFRHTDEHVRIWSIRLLTENWTIDDALGPAWVSDQRAHQIADQLESILPSLVLLAREDHSAIVRLTLASTLQRLPVSQRATLAEALVTRSEDADDHNIPLMIWYGLVAVADVNCDDLVRVAKVCQIPKTLRLISRCLAEEMERQPDALNRLLAHVASLDDQTYAENVLTGVAEGFKGWHRAQKPVAWDAITRREFQDCESLVRELSVLFGDGRALDELKAVALGETEADDDVRLAALETLIQAKPDDLRDICEALLRDNRMNVVAARGLSMFDDSAIGEVIVQRYRNFRGPFRPQIMSILVSRPSFAEAMLSAIRDGEIPREDLSAYQVRQIHSYGDAELSDVVGQVWGEVRESPTEIKQRIRELKESLSLDVLASSDKRNGRALFAKLCQNCHRMYGEGANIGPDLTGSNRANLDYLLSNILDPSGVVDKDFRMTVLLLEDARIMNGLITAETDRTISLQTATESLTFDKASVESRKVTEKSPMPDGLLETLSKEQIRDLIGYLSHPSQMPLPE